MVELIDTIEKPIMKPQGEVLMNDKERCRGFSPEQQVDHEKHLVNRYGEKPTRILRSLRKTKGRIVQEWEAMSAE